MGNQKGIKLIKTNSTKKQQSETLLLRVGVIVFLHKTTVAGRSRKAIALPKIRPLHSRHDGPGSIR